LQRGIGTITQGDELIAAKWDEAAVKDVGEVQSLLTLR
jgi:ubiquinone biosynthesis protein Coq4